MAALRKSIIETGKRIYARGYVASNDGNISARIDEKRVMITPTGVSKGFMEPDDLIIVDMEGKVLSGSRRKTSESDMHLSIYRDRPDVNSVCHTHPPYATGFAVAGIALDQMALPEVIITLGSVPVVEYGTTGTEDLYGRISAYIKTYDAFLLANHGALTVGSSVLDAYHKMETIEHAAKIQFIARQLGRVNTLPREEVDKLIASRPKYGVRVNVGLKDQEQK